MFSLFCLLEMTNYIEVNGIVFAPINNINNSYCYHLTVVQLFHISPTFNACMKRASSVDCDEFMKQMLEPFAIYANISSTNYMDTYRLMKISYDKLISEIIDDYAKNGYCPFILEYYYILPILYKMFPIEFKQILEEITVQTIHFNVSKQFINNIYENSPFMKRKYNSMMLNLACDMCSRFRNFTITDKTFKAGILEVYPDRNHIDGGHALFLLKKKNTFYIFDDDLTIDMFEKYVNDRINNIYKICIRTDDENAVNELECLWKGNILTKRINNRYEFVNRQDNQQSKEIAQIATSFIELRKPKSEILPNENMNFEIENDEEQLVGGNEIPMKTKSYKGGFIAFLIISIVLLIILIIEAVIVVKNKKAQAGTATNDTKSDMPKTETPATPEPTEPVESETPEPTEPEPTEPEAPATPESAETPKTPENFVPMSQIRTSFSSRRFGSRF